MRSQGLPVCALSISWFLFLGSNQEKTFGPTISGLIYKHIEPERLLLWDSKARGGRPDSMKIIKEAYEYWGAEGRKLTAMSIPLNELANMLPSVVFITSNWQGNKELMEGCKAEGIPAFVSSRISIKSRQYS